MTLKSWAKRMIPEWAMRWRQERRLSASLRKSWEHRQTSSTDDHLNVYWDSAELPNRKKLIELLVKCLAQSPKSTAPSVLEYGSHVGINFKLLNEALSSPGVFYATELNKEACDFMKAKLPEVNVLNADDRGFIKADFPNKKVHLSFVNSVFYCMSAKRFQAVLQKLAKISDVILLGESMDNLDGKKSTFCNEPACYHHPYKKWLTDLGFNAFEFIPAPDPRPQLNGFLIARK